MMYSVQRLYSQNPAAAAPPHSIFWLAKTANSSSAIA